MTDSVASGAAPFVLPRSAEVTSAGQASYAELCRRLKIVRISSNLRTRLYFRYRYLAKGELLCSVGEKFEELFVISSGCLKAEVYHNQKSLISRFLMSGDISGIEGIDKGRHACSVIALTNAVVVAVPYITFRKLCSDSVEFRFAFVRHVSKSIYSKREHVRMLAGENAQTKVAKFLTWLSEKTEDSGFSKHLVTTQMSRADIASYLGLTCETVSRVLGRLRDLQLIEVAGNRIEIKDYFSLACVAKNSRQFTRAKYV